MKFNNDIPSPLHNTTLNFSEDTHQSFLQSARTTTFEKQSRLNYIAININGSTQKQFCVIVDALAWIQREAQAPMFFTLLKQYLQDKKRSISPLVQHLAYCESQQKPLSDLQLTNINLFKFHKIKFNDTQFFYRYFLCGGQSEIQRINTLDNQFFQNFFDFIDHTTNNSFEVERIDLAYDSTYDFSPYLSAAITQGHFWTNGHKPYAYALYDGQD